MLGTERRSAGHGVPEAGGRQNSLHEQRVEDEQQKQRQKREQRLIDVVVAELVLGTVAELGQLGTEDQLRRDRRAVIGR